MRLFRLGLTACGRSYTCGFHSQISSGRRTRQVKVLATQREDIALPCMDFISDV